MKRVISLILVLMMMIPAALAEGNNPATPADSVENSIQQAMENLSKEAEKAVENLSKEAEKTVDEATKWVEDTYGEAAKWTEGAWKEVTKWVEGSWGDAAKWVEKTWNDSSAWISGIWGDLSSWASDSIDSANAWWKETFKKVTETSDNVWSWFTAAAYGADTAFYEDYNKLKEVISDAGSATLDSVKNAYMPLLKKLGMNDQDAEKIWKTVLAYADQKGLDQLTTATLALPYLFKLTVDSSLESKSIPPVNVAQFLTAALDKLNIDSAATAEKLLKQLKDLLASF